MRSRAGCTTRHPLRGTGVTPGQAVFTYPLYHLYQEKGTRYTRGKTAERTGELGLECLTAPERTPYGNGQKNVVLVVRGRAMLADQAKRRTMPTPPRGTPGAGKSLAVQALAQVRRGSRGCTTSRGTGGSDGLPAARFEADRHAKPPCGPQAARPSLAEGPRHVRRARVGIPSESVDHEAPIDAGWHWTGTRRPLWAIRDTAIVGGRGSVLHWNVKTEGSESIPVGRELSGLFACADEGEAWTAGIIRG